MGCCASQDASAKAEADSNVSRTASRAQEDHVTTPTANPTHARASSSKYKVDDANPTNTAGPPTDTAPMGKNGNIPVHANTRSSPQARGSALPTSSADFRTSSASSVPQLVADNSKCVCLSCGHSTANSFAAMFLRRFVEESAGESSTAHAASHGKLLRRDSSLTARSGAFRSIVYDEDGNTSRSTPGRDLQNSKQQHQQQQLVVHDIRKASIDSANSDLSGAEHSQRRLSGGGGEGGGTLSSQPGGATPSSPATLTASANSVSQKLPLAATPAATALNTTLALDYRILFDLGGPSFATSALIADPNLRLELWAASLNANVAAVPSELFLPANTASDLTQSGSGPLLNGSQGGFGPSVSTDRTAPHQLGSPGPATLKPSLSNLSSVSAASSRRSSGGGSSLGANPVQSWSDYGVRSAAVSNWSRGQSSAAGGSSRRSSTGQQPGTPQADMIDVPVVETSGTDFDDALDASLTQNSRYLGSPGGTLVDIGSSVHMKRVLDRTYELEEDDILAPGRRASADLVRSRFEFARLLGYVPKRELIGFNGRSGGPPSFASFRQPDPSEEWVKRPLRHNEVAVGGRRRTQSEAFAFVAGNGSSMSARDRHDELLAAGGDEENLPAHEHLRAYEEAVRIRPASPGQAGTEPTSDLEARAQFYHRQQKLHMAHPPAPGGSPQASGGDEKGTLASSSVFDDTDDEDVLVMVTPEPPPAMHETVIVRRSMDYKRWRRVELWRQHVATFPSFSQLHQMSSGTVVVGGKSASPKELLTESPLVLCAACEVQDLALCGMLDNLCEECATDTDVLVHLLQPASPFTVTNSAGHALVIGCRGGFAAPSANESFSGAQQLGNSVSSMVAAAPSAGFGRPASGTVVLAAETPPRAASTTPQPPSGADIAADAEGSAPPSSGEQLPQVEPQPGRVLPAGVAMRLLLSTSDIHSHAEAGDDIPVIVIEAPTPRQTAESDHSDNVCTPQSASEPELGNQEGSGAAEKDDPSAFAISSTQLRSDSLATDPKDETSSPASAASRSSSDSATKSSLRRRTPSEQQGSTSPTDVKRVRLPMDTSVEGCEDSGGTASTLARDASPSSLQLSPSARTSALLVPQQQELQQPAEDSRDYWRAKLAAARDGRVNDALHAQQVSPAMRSGNANTGANKLQQPAYGRRSGKIGKGVPHETPPPGASRFRVADVADTKPTGHPPPTVTPPQSPATQLSKQTGSSSSHSKAPVPAVHDDEPLPAWL